MSQLWLKLLERIGKPLGARPGLAEIHDPANFPHGLWHEYGGYDVLFQLYGPPAESPWYPYHCPTLFAAIDRLNLQPRLTELSPEVQAAQTADAWQWLQPDTFVVMEMAGGLSVQMGATLSVLTGAQLICAFDHWPMANPQQSFSPASYLDMAPLPWPPQQVRSDVAIDSRDIIDCMVTLAPQVARCHRAGIAPLAPAVWLTDARRMVATRPGPGDFDNRYYIDDSLLPSEELLRRRGIDKLVYFSTLPEDQPGNDLSVFLNECHDGGIRLQQVALSDPDSWASPLPMSPPPVVRLSGLSFPKSQVGGFGVRIPKPSESSGGSFSGAGG